MIQCRAIFTLMLAALLIVQSSAQRRDTSATARANDTLHSLQVSTIKVPDSILYKKFISYYDNIAARKHGDTAIFSKSFEQRLFASPGLQLNEKSILSINEPHIHRNKDVLFYILAGMFLLLGIVMYFFDDYFMGFLQSFTQPGYRLSQTRENLARGQFPSFLLNLLFVLCGGLTVALFIQHSVQAYNLWELWAIFSGILASVYMVKFVVLKLSGYLFNAGEAVSTYTHIVFMVNKFTGILLLFLLMFIAFRDNPTMDPLVQKVFSVLIVVFILLLLYRYFVSFILIKNNLKIKAFHFFIYLCAVEFIPILVTYKFLTEQINARGLT